MPITILRTAAGSPVAPSLIKEFKKYDCRVIAVDCAVDSCGKYFADKFYQVPRVKEPNYIDELLRVCREENVDIFIPDLDEELLLVSENRARFNEIGCEVILSDTNTLINCVDKYKTYQFFKKHNIPFVNSLLTNEVDKNNLSFPLFLKPRQGRGSQGVFKINNLQEFEYHTGMATNFIIQPFVSGKEYTIDVLSDFEGNYLYASIRERSYVDSGISTKGITIEDDEILTEVKKASNLLKLKGPTCFQCFKTDNGDIQFFEINPRIAGTAILSISAGMPIVEDILNIYNKNRIKGISGWKKNTRVMRYWSEIIVEDGN